jgi:hypothetical protein
VVKRNGVGNWPQGIESWLGENRECSAKAGRGGWRLKSFAVFCSPDPCEEGGCSQSRFKILAVFPFLCDSQELSACVPQGLVKCQFFTWADVWPCALAKSQMSEPELNHPNVDRRATKELRTISWTVPDTFMKFSLK